MSSLSKNSPIDRVLVVTSVAAERDAVLRGLHGDSRFDVIIGGVGAAAAAMSTAKALAAAESGYGLVLCAGIAGGFVNRAKVGDIVVASEIIAADLGAETPEGFLSVDELGFGSARVAVEAGLASRLHETLCAAGCPAQIGSVLTLSTVTGTAETAERLAARYPNAAAEAMEGYGVALAALDQELPSLELRAVSNAIGPRDRAAWRIKEALEALEADCSVLPEVYL